ncbi:hypothetical protein ACIRCZ_18935 [Leifsonia sp. NPDC102414]|uniref:hypothetical protein n=1 Tax=Leifsonia sp. NPDC102414 TaxID=3364124 RepID=UPI00381815F2
MTATDVPARSQNEASHRSSPELESALRSWPIPGVSPVEEFGVGLPLTLMRWVGGVHGHELRTETGILRRDTAAEWMLQVGAVVMIRPKRVWRARLEAILIPDRVALTTANIPRGDGKGQTRMLLQRAGFLGAYRTCGLRQYATIRQEEHPGAATFTIIDQLRTPAVI